MISATGLGSSSRATRFSTKPSDLLPQEQQPRHQTTREEKSWRYYYHPSPKLPCLLSSRLARNCSSKPTPLSPCSFNYPPNSDSKSRPHGATTQDQSYLKSVSNGTGCSNNTAKNRSAARESLSSTSTEKLDAKPSRSTKSPSAPTFSARGTSTSPSTRSSSSPAPRSSPSASIKTPPVKNHGSWPSWSQRIPVLEPNLQREGNFSEPTTGLQQDTVQGLVAAAGEDPNEEINKTYAYRLLATERDAGNTITTLSDNTIANLFPKSFRLGLMDDCAMFQAARTGEFNFSREDGGPRGRDHDAL
ncbi:hypothetical protein MBM_01512 [Drepanopeziza brunnea f. sp. 'multigermtubi' MB_m1]|uniref:Uncharacterized protein n=1 Tax=Marssonina brunnea f. sp. multigermtubi (strain MB_m1) TaxID=1072389 RepID=K1WT56_MARBU|nr:uncharacterized protein MBM_01512 [Drepanopeziza brunnea f. sp. 'multigermtubi' MB_m1]EKD20830.1 hypothetical protein MBM_01512 [Drepanopeziza brunnea f. sp. 'multigermtubi' MB_m1]